VHSDIHWNTEAHKLKTTAVYTHTNLLNTECSVVLADSIVIGLCIIHGLSFNLYVVQYNVIMHVCWKNTCDQKQKITKDRNWNLNKGQSNLALSIIAMNWGFQPPNLNFVWGTGAVLLGTTRVSLPNGISFHPTALAGWVNERVEFNVPLDT